MTMLNPTQYFHAAMIHVDYCNYKSPSYQYKNRFRSTPAENIKRMLMMSMILKVLDHVKKLLKTMLVEMLGPDVI